MTAEKQAMDAGWNLDNSYSRLPGTFFKDHQPSPVTLPKLVILNEGLASSLGLNSEKLRDEQSIAIFAGNQIPDGVRPLAQAYAGHQFGHFNMLGDGRAILLGEQITPQDERFDIQLKGSGRTPYSRGGDGRATLGPMLREYIISEAMRGLGIPTTLSLAVVTTGEEVIRETDLPGAVLVRVASSHIRVGTFQYAAEWGTVEDLKALADYTIKRHFPEIEGEQHCYLSLLQEVIKRQAELIAKWLQVGFIHGVMNTDNMAISGETIDYGPCAFMNEYDPATVFSSIDRQGRYAYGNQRFIGGWNLARFAESLLRLLHEDQDEAVKLAQEEISNYTPLFHSYWLTGMRAKLGLFNEEDEDEALIEDLLSIMHNQKADYTNTFRDLTIDQGENQPLFKTAEGKQWYERWQQRVSGQHEPKDASIRLMKESNPAIIPRNHRVEEALQAAVDNNDYSVMERLLEALANPYEYSTLQEEYSTLPPQSTRPYQTFCGT
ncbi:protein adenylyltransferase SelO [Bacillus suaedae]|uniref:Protein nucleotidyltransferase YdiU n=1 Tax=Halalkalibacter suaedae TaxID=2822140 RepID=A0A941ARF7_9BACI|nr:YdiU family protein [Bacillus suaedae]MBP3952498.1 YdiU family protein [Bacillus suaedae]